MDLTATVFAHLNQFPALSQFNVEDCSIGSKHRKAARNHGWNYKTSKDLNDWLVKGGTSGAGWDSIIHASFQLGGAFSEKTLTAEGVEAILVLHVCVGAAQPDALVDVKGDRSLISFYRERFDPSEFPLNRKIAPNITTSRKKPKLRASKQQKMEDLLTGFGQCA